jgi:hypothetical protein
MHIDISALRRQWNVSKLFALLVAGCGARLSRRLRLVLGIYSAFRRANHSLLLIMTSSQDNHEQPENCRTSGTF